MVLDYIHIQKVLRISNVLLDIRRSILQDFNIGHAIHTIRETLPLFMYIFLQRVLFCRGEYYPEHESTLK